MLHQVNLFFKELFKLLKNEAKIADVQSKEECLQDHIENAIHIPLVGLIRSLDDFTVSGKTTIFYSNSGKRISEAKRNHTGRKLNIYKDGEMQMLRNNIDRINVQESLSQSNINGSYR